MLAGELGIQPRPGDLPISLGGFSRNSQHLRGFFHTQSTEVTQFNQTALTAIDFSQRSQSAIECDHFNPASLYFHKHLIEWDA